MNLHPAFQARIDEQLEEDAPAFWDALTHQPPREGLRVNTLKLSVEDFQERSPFPLTPLPWTKSGFTLGESDEPPGKHPYHAAGLYYLQEPSAMAVAEVLAPQPGERILDLAAAPGGKSTHIASLVKNQGFLLANDPHKGRAQALARNLERWGVTNAAVTTETPDRLAEHFGPFFDRVLVDAPCSGEGMFRKSPREREQWTPNLVERCAAQQDDILWHAAQLVRPGGTLVYSTCTFAPLENEGTVARFLEARPDFEIFPIPVGEGLTIGRGTPSPSGTARIWPHLAPGEGHFIARLQRSPEGMNAQAVPGTRFLGPSRMLRKGTAFLGLERESLGYYQTFFAESLQAENVPPFIHPGSERLTQLGNRLYAIPAQLPNLRGLSVMHWGWWLGTFKTKRFEPSHALAMALTPDAVKMSISLSAEDRDTIGYIRGLPFRSEGPQGWVLVCVDGYPLGWGKRVQGRVRSHSPRWLRG